MGLSVLLLSLLPAVIYILVIYVTVPYKKINLTTAFAYLFVGFMSVGFLKYMWMAFPSLTTLAESVTNPIFDPFRFYHYYYFLQVALLEELSKVAIFFLIERYRRKSSSVKDHPIATMFYMGMVALGFAVIENIHYGMMYGDGVLYWRAITSVIGHMVFGLFMGYWIAMGRMGARFYDRSLFDIVINKRKRIRNVVYTIFGISAATILHGIYDLHLQFNGQSGITGIYILLVFSLLGVYWCFKNLNRLYKIKQEKLRES